MCGDVFEALSWNVYNNAKHARKYYKVELPAKGGGLGCSVEK